jgi:hypothetical protein
MSVIPTCERLRQEFRVSLGYICRLSLLKEMHKKKCLAVYFMQLTRGKENF